MDYAHLFAVLILVIQHLNRDGDRFLWLNLRTVRIVEANIQEHIHLGPLACLLQIFRLTLGIVFGIAFRCNRFCFQLCFLWNLSLQIIFGNYDDVQSINSALFPDAEVPWFRLTNRISRRNALPESCGLLSCLICRNTVLHLFSPVFVKTDYVNLFALFRETFWYLNRDRYRCLRLYLDASRIEADVKKQIHSVASGNLSKILGLTLCIVRSIVFSRNLPYPKLCLLRNVRSGVVFRNHRYIAVLGLFAEFMLHLCFRFPDKSYHHGLRAVVRIAYQYHRLPCIISIFIQTLYGECHCALRPDFFSIDKEAEPVGYFFCRGLHAILSRDGPGIFILCLRRVGKFLSVPCRFHVLSTRRFIPVFLRSLRCIALSLRADAFCHKLRFLRDVRGLMVFRHYPDFRVLIYLPEKLLFSLAVLWLSLTVLFRFAALCPGLIRSSIPLLGFLRCSAFLIGFFALLAGSVRLYDFEAVVRVHMLQELDLLADEVPLLVIAAVLMCMQLQFAADVVFLYGMTILRMGMCVLSLRYLAV